MTFKERSLFDQGNFLQLWSSGATGRLQSGASLYAKQLEGTLNTHQNGKVEGEAVGNLDRRLEWKTIHVGTYTTEQVQGVP